MSKKKKIIISFLSFAFVALLSCGIALLPNWNPSPTTPPSDIGQEEGGFETEAATQPTNTSGTWIDSGRRGTSFGGGSGTESDPYLISNAQQLAYLAYMVNAGNTYSGKYFEQTANIDLSAYYWEPIGASSHLFSGNYTANPFGVITNLYIKSDYAGLFGCVENATISNIGISSGYIEGESFAGGLVGGIYAGITTITNCHNTGDVSGTDDYSNTGGLVGRASDGTTITQCYNTGDVSGAGYSSPGGLVGLAYDITITQCYNTGNVTRSSAYSYEDSVGGLVGDAIGAVTITDSYNTGDVSSDADYAGGLVAQAGDYLTIINSYNTGVITNTSTNTSSTGSCAGGLVGDAGNYLTIINSYNTGVITSTSSNSTNTARSCAGGLVGGAGITTITDSYNTGVVTSSAPSFYAGGLVGDAALATTITNCYNTGNVTSTTTTTTHSLYSYAGGLVGDAYNITITNCYNTGNVTSTTTTSCYTGGLVGVIEEGSLSCCHNIGDISASSARVRAGAIANVFVNSVATFTKCYYYCEGARGGVNGKDVSGTSENANLLGSDIIFRSQSDYTNTALWTDPFWDFDNTWKIVNDMNGNYPVLIELTEFTLTVNPNGGTWNGSSSSQSFTQNYNTTKSIPNPETRYGYYFDGWILLGSGSISGTTFTFGGGDCTLIANWIETWAVNYTKPSGNGTASSPYQVDSASDLAYFAYKTQILGEKCYDHIVLTKDIDLSGYDWMPIGTGRNVVPGQQANFFGVFDGQGHSISNLNINVEGYQELNEYGLFGLIDVDAVLKNFTITSGEVNGNERVGGVVGWVWSASVENVTNYANVNGSKSVGGIIGKYHSWEDDFVRECRNYGTITGGNYTGGIVGGGDDSSGTQNIVNCYNFGNVSGSQEIVGGIAGYIRSAKISGCVNYGAVSGSSYHVGGILGIANAGEMQQCHVEGSVKGASHTGGLLGYVYDDGSFSLIDCGVNGEVLTAYVANSNGLIGQGSNLEITNCYFIGEFTDHSGNAQNMSGFVGYGSTNAVNDSYFIANGNKTVQNTTGFEDWTIISGVNGGNPVQKELYHIAGVGGDSEKLDTWLKTNNILSDGSFEYGDWSAWTGTSELSTEHARSGQHSWKMTEAGASYGETYSRTIIAYPIDPTHIYFVRMYAYQEVQHGGIQAYWQDKEPSIGSTTLGPAGQWNMYGWRFDRVGFSGSQFFRIDFEHHNQVGELWVDDVLLIDLTAMYGAGNEPSQEECMRLFA